MTVKKIIYFIAVLACSGNALGEQTAATVNGVAINESLVKQVIEANANRVSRDKALESLIQRELIRQLAVKNGIDKRGDVRERFKLLQNELITSIYIQEIMDKTKISSKEYEDTYKKTSVQLPTNSYHLSDILLPDEDGAKKIIAKLNKGADFADLARAKSTGPNASQGGELGWITESAMPAGFRKAVTTAKTGTYIKHPLKTEFGYHVVFVHERKSTKPPTLEELKPRLRQLILQKKVRQYIDDLVKKAKIERN